MQHTWEDDTTAGMNVGQDEPNADIHNEVEGATSNLAESTNRDDMEVYNILQNFENQMAEEFQESVRNEIDDRFSFEDDELDNDEGQ